MKIQGTQNSEIILKKNRVRELILPSLKTNYKVAVIRGVNDLA